MAKMVVDTEAMRRTAGEFEQEIGYWHDLVDQIWRAMTDLTQCGTAMQTTPLTP